MGRWVGCALLLLCACTRSNPWFHTVGQDGSTGGESSTSIGESTRGLEGTSTGETTGGGVSGETGGHSTSSGPGQPDTGDPVVTTTAAMSTTTGGDVDDTTTSGTTTSGAGDSSDGGDSSDSSDGGDSSDTNEGPCMAACGTPGCGDCPDAKMVAFPNFSIDATEVTNDQYAMFLAAKVAPAVQDAKCGWNLDFTPGVWPPPQEAGGVPVVRVDWCDAVAFCRWSGKRLCGKIGGGAVEIDDGMMNEANFNLAKSQWFRACAGEPKKNYPYGSSYKPTACNGMEAGKGKPIAAGSMPECQGSLPGVYDLSGNVFEWVDACVSDDANADCMRRGGSYVSTPTILQCNIDSRRPRSLPEGYVGLRCCSDP